MRKKKEGNASLVGFLALVFPYFVIESRSVFYMERTELNRRNFIIKTSLAVTGAAITGPLAAHAESLHSPLPDAAPPPEPLPNLAEYLKEIEPIRLSYQSTIANDELFSVIKNLPTQKRIDLFNQYFPMYEAAHRAYNVPVIRLFVIHLRETAASTHPRPDNLSARGGMQRNPEFYPDEKAVKAAEGWHRLSQLKQNYDHNGRSETRDYQEIMFAAWKLRKDANNAIIKQSYLTDTQALDEAQTTYCDATEARFRNNHIGQIQDYYDQHKNDLNYDYHQAKIQQILEMK
ncbi:hypothetical protein M1563_00960 [Patescibacteria group bacterium]|nr:hypothetical protein [Patescibacteria group bacterium]MCL5410163.1 hypothetical protein [Patescibacteria group bacterium]